jgi:hypothetical protein
LICNTSTPARAHWIATSQPPIGTGQKWPSFRSPGWRRQECAVKDGKGTNTAERADSAERTRRQPGATIKSGQCPAEAKRAGPPGNDEPERLEDMEAEAANSIFEKVMRPEHWSCTRGTPF